jgi:hypothetical protein
MEGLDVTGRPVREQIADVRGLFAFAYGFPLVMMDLTRQVLPGYDICCDCGDDPHLDYREVSPELQRVRGPYPIAEGIAAYKRHLGVHRQPARAARGGR